MPNMRILNFKSDNEAPAHEKVVDALVQANDGYATAYAADEWSLRLDQAFSDYFETDVSVLPLATGTAANSIILGTLSPPWGAIYCHPNAHIHNDEGGAPEFYTHGAKLCPVCGENGKLDAAILDETITQAGAHGVHNVAPAVVSITQATECGTAYTADEITSISEVAKKHGLPMHMDGARFANAVSYLEASPAEITWRAGIDVLAFGGTKNGAMDAEAIIVFGNRPDWLEGMHRRRKRGGHLLSKMRFVSAQLLALLENGLGHTLAGQANLKAQKLAKELSAHQHIALKWPVEANEVFIETSEAMFQHLEANGVAFHRWPGYRNVGRLVCSFQTPDEAIDALIHLTKTGP